MLFNELNSIFSLRFFLGTLDSLRCYVSTSSALPTKVRPGSAPNLCATKHSRDGSLRRSGFSTNSFTSTLQSSFVLSRIILHMLLVIGISAFLISASSASIRRHVISSCRCNLILQILLLLRPSLPITLFNYNSVVDDPRQTSLSGSSSFCVLVGIMLLYLACNNY